MHFFNLDGMIEDLKADRLTEGQYFRYLVGYFAVVGFPTEIFSISEQAKKAPDALFMLIGYGIGFGLLYWFLSSIYQANRGEHGKNFFLRYFMLSWVVGFRSFSATFPFSVILWYVVKFEVVSPASWIVLFLIGTVLVSFLAGLIYYLTKMHTAFRALAEHDQLTSVAAREVR
ncbi:MAG: hypothetical protein J0L82_12695 [Deltaproteobacteria bacterium]|jgi:hypothetical protein|nr:hypothetical protein [Deltaproteobacteria bacterium]